MSVYGAHRRDSRARRTKSAADVVRLGSRRFRRARIVFGHGTTNAADEAAYLVAHALKVRPDFLSGMLDQRLSRTELEAALTLIERRVRERKPAAYLTKEAWLADLRFYVDERVIVPRSHIAELLVEHLAPWVGVLGKITTALDLCTGSGCLAVLLARAFPRARIDAADISAAALEVARINVRRYRLGSRVRLAKSDLFSNLGGKRYDLIVCNPPYVTGGDMRRLPREYRHEPPVALSGGKDGLEAVRRIVRKARDHLNPRGLLVVEVGAGKRRVERGFPRVEFVWPETAAGRPIFIISREQLPRELGR